MYKKDSYQVTEIKPQDIFTLDEVKNFLRVSYDHDDDLINNLISAAIATAEEFIGITILQRQIEFKTYTNNRFCYLKYGLVHQILEISIMKDHNKNILNQDQYSFCASKNKVELSKSYISTQITVKYVAGMFKETISNSLRQALLMHISIMYERTDNNILPNEIRSIYLLKRKYKL